MSPEKNRIFNLICEGKKPKEIAKIMNCTPEHVYYIKWYYNKKKQKEQKRISREFQRFHKSGSKKEIDRKILSMLKLGKKPKNIAVYFGTTPEHVYYLKWYYKNKTTLSRKLKKVIQVTESHRIKRRLPTLKDIRNEQRIRVRKMIHDEVHTQIWCLLKNFLNHEFKS